MHDVAIFYIIPAIFIIDGSLYQTIKIPIQHFSILIALIRTAHLLHRTVKAKINLSVSYIILTISCLCSACISKIYHSVFTDIPPGTIVFFHKSLIRCQPTIYKSIPAWYTINGCPEDTIIVTIYFSTGYCIQIIVIISKIKFVWTLFYKSGITEINLSVVHIPDAIVIFSQTGIIKIYQTGFRINVPPSTCIGKYITDRRSIVPVSACQLTLVKAVPAIVSFHFGIIYTGQVHLLHTVYKISLERNFHPISNRLIAFCSSGKTKINSSAFDIPFNIIEISSTIVIEVNLSALCNVPPGSAILCQTGIRILIPHTILEIEPSIFSVQCCLCQTGKSGIYPSITDIIKSLMCFI